MSRAIEHLQELVQIPTISRLDESLVDWATFDRFIATLERLFPLVHQKLTREVVGEHSLLFRWEGRAAAQPAVLMAHYDVVAATDDGWEHPPFAGDIVGLGDDAEIWGRGTVDDKGSLVALLEGVEAALSTGHTPARDIYLVFGHDEETTGTGAAAIAELLGSRGIRPLLVLDEGGAVVRGTFPGIAGPAAAIGISEKGATLVELIVEQQGGHASTPPRLSTTARLARAILRINDHPFPAAFPPPVLSLFAALGPHATGLIGWALRSAKFTSPLLLQLFSRGTDEMRAITRTTQAVTQLEAGHAANALAERATAMVNLRIAVGSSVDETLAYLRKIIRDDAVQLRLVAGGEPAPVSPVSGDAWSLVTAAVRSHFPDAVIAPYVQNGATDSRHFVGLTTAVYRFAPFELTKAERDALHAKNERMHVAAYLKGIEFYRTLVLEL
jgi:carboxypeptidase PM20D1